VGGYQGISIIQAVPHLIIQAVPPRPGFIFGFIAGSSLEES
jgi:hypothetical protein